MITPKGIRRAAWETKRPFGVSGLGVASKKNKLRVRKLSLGRQSRCKRGAFVLSGSIPHGPTNPKEKQSGVERETRHDSTQTDAATALLGVVAKR